MAADLSEKNSTERLLLRALVISVVIHLTIFGAWKWGQSQGWWRNLNLLTWLPTPSKLLMPSRSEKLPARVPSEPSQLVFVDVDPALASTVPPKNPKFYSANSSLVANPSPKQISTVPEIRGHQDKMLKTTPDTQSKAK